MNELIKIETNENGDVRVSGRELHAFLEVKTPYIKWFPRMVEYAFTEGEDFWTNLSESTGGRPATDHMMTIDMAKELCMVQRTERGKQARQYFLSVEKDWNSPAKQRTERGKQARQYFLSVEKDWNSPAKVMARALMYAQKQIESLGSTVQVQQQQIAELQPKATYYDLILQCKNAIPISVIAKDYGYSARKMNELLNEYGIQFKQGKNGPWLLYQKYADKGYTNTKTQNFPDKDGDKDAELPRQGRRHVRPRPHVLDAERPHLPLRLAEVEEHPADDGAGAGGRDGGELTWKRRKSRRWTDTNTATSSSRTSARRPTKSRRSSGFPARKPWNPPSNSYAGTLEGMKRR